MSDLNSFNNPPELNAEPSFESKRNKKSKRKIIISVVLVLIIITGIAGLGFAKGYYDKHRPHGPLGMIMDMAMKDLDLTDQQKNEVAKIKEEIQLKMDSQQKPDRRKEMDEMMDMFRGSTFDKQKALDMMKQRDAERDEMRSFMIDQTAKFHAILTPDQRNKAVDKMKEFREKRKERKDKWKKEDGKQ
ncbi:MAG TPA: Spy/CpxP family protein refolding chaperone [Ignavibacteria bacterium]|nr:Spy/CpxP family protein refolding chaperone [Ignavibacteria bacterium]HRF67258.1 Spy/CpxP family protein refolding chaperone [Ignavibacteria bacterium]HRJ05801.1 Spy/CpxP family protein refolding chaperone [Ignavibacteria bacterium]HRJ86771.1 Spy/CpxP family protein refolding chaperone [Ignavibacteria bacterium]